MRKIKLNSAKPRIRIWKKANKRDIESEREREFWRGKKSL
jgi:hypothetical protein